MEKHKIEIKNFNEDKFCCGCTYLYKLDFWDEINWMCADCFLNELKNKYNIVEMEEGDKVYNFYLNKVSKEDFNEIFSSQTEDLKDNYEDEANGISDYDKYIKWEYKEQLDFLIPFLISYGWTGEELINKYKEFKDGRS